MGTVVRQEVRGKNAQRAADAAIKEMRRLEKLLSRFRLQSEVAWLNRMAGRKPVAVRPETFQVLSRAIDISRMSGGAFDVTIGPLVEAWSVTSDNPAPPPDATIQELRRRVDYRGLSLDGRAGTAYLSEPGQTVDLGGIGKGFAGDRAVEVYRRYGVSSAVLDIGGNILMLGTKEDGMPWRIGIQDPDGDRGEYLGVLLIRDRSVVTSGDYERYFEVGGKRYHHIIDPATGYPAESGLRSVTVVAADSLTADALSTAAFVLGLDGGKRLIEQAGAADAVFVTKSREVFVTPGLRQAFQMTCPARYAMMMR